MNKRATSLLAALPAALAGIGLMLALSTAPAGAAAKKGLSPPVFKVLKEANDLATKNPPDYAGALAKVKEAEALPNATPYDSFKMKDMEFQYDAVMGDYAGAAAAAEAAFQTNQWAPEDKPRLLKAMVELFHATKDDTKAQLYAQQYLKEVGPDLEVQAVSVDISRIKGDNAAALTGAQDLINKARASKTPIKEAWWQLLLLSAASVKNEDATMTALFGMAEDYPSKDVWHDLAGHLYNKPDRTNSYSLACLRLMDAAGAISTSEEMLSIAQLALTIGLPGEAKQVIKEGEASGILPGKEKTLVATLKTQINTETKGEPGNLDAADATAAASKSGAADISVGEEFAAYGMYDKAVTSINRGLGKASSLKTPDEGRISLGWVYFLAGKYDDAKTAFESVKTDPRSTDLAKAWLILIKNKTNPPAPPKQ